MIVFGQGSDHFVLQMLKPTISDAQRSKSGSCFVVPVRAGCCIFLGNFRLRTLSPEADCWNGNVDSAFPLLEPAFYNHNIGPIRWLA